MSGNDDGLGIVFYLVVLAVCLAVAFGIHSCESNACQRAGGQLTGGMRDPLCVAPDGRILTGW